MVEEVSVLQTCRCVISYQSCGVMAIPNEGSLVQKLGLEGISRSVWSLGD